MSSLLIIPGSRPPHGKDCYDWVPLKDGTIVGDPKYCDLSERCRQIGMITHYYEIYDTSGKVIEIKYYCTGMYPKDNDELRYHDEEVF